MEKKWELELNDDGSENIFPALGSVAPGHRFHPPDFFLNEKSAQKFKNHIYKIDSNFTSIQVFKVISALTCVIRLDLTTR